MNVGARGQSSGYSDTIDDSHTPYFRELFAMTNEWPYQAYAKAGRFVPAFGLKLDDHTTRTRREFELDTSLPETRVLGVEAGAVAAYPFVQVSYFKMKNKFEQPDPWNIFDVDDGWGTAFNLGWRDLGWSLGTSAMMRRRPLDQGGNTDTYALYGSLQSVVFRHATSGHAAGRSRLRKRAARERARRRTSSSCTARSTGRCGTASTCWRRTTGTIPTAMSSMTRAGGSNSASK